MRNKKVHAGHHWPALFLALAVCTGVHAAVIEAEGIASIEKGGIEHARRVATEDAVRQASLQLGAVVVSTEKMTPAGPMVRSAIVRPTGESPPYAVVREWSEGNTLHVLVRAEDRGNAPAEEFAQTYKKKILVAPFHVNRPMHASDIGDLTNGIPRDLSERLARSGRFQPRVGMYAVPQEGKGWTSAQVAAVITRLAMETDSQFVLTGEVVDIGMTTEKGLFTSRTTRRFEVRTALYDGLTGALIAERRSARAGEGDMGVDINRPFGSAAFFSTDFGKVVNPVLAYLAAETVEDLAPLPFTARVVGIENEKVMFDAGATSSIRPGDSLVAYSKKVLWDAGTTPPGTAGILEAPVGTVSVVQVHPGFSIGELSAAARRTKLKVGDYVRFESSQ